MYYFHLKYAKNGINRLMYGLIYKYAFIYKDTWRFYFKLYAHTVPQPVRKW